VCRGVAALPRRGRPQENKSVPVMRQAERYGLLEHIKWIGQILHDVPPRPRRAPYMLQFLCSMDII